MLKIKYLEALTFYITQQGFNYSSQGGCCRPHSKRNVGCDFHKQTFNTSVIHKAHCTGLNIPVDLKECFSSYLQNTQTLFNGDQIVIYI